MISFPISKSGINPYFLSHPPWIEQVSVQLSRTVVSTFPLSTYPLFSLCQDFILFAFDSVTMLMPPPHAGAMGQFRSLKANEIIMIRQTMFSAKLFSRTSFSLCGFNVPISRPFKKPNKKRSKWSPFLVTLIQLFKIMPHIFLCHTWAFWYSFHFSQSFVRTQRFVVVFKQVISEQNWAF